MSFRACSDAVFRLDVIKKNKFKAPTPIQAQALPAIMSGRDIIGVARTGSGKTLAYLLPLFRRTRTHVIVCFSHVCGADIMDQRPVEQGEGPIALVMTPTRELGVQIFSEVRRFAKHLNVRVRMHLYLFCPFLTFFRFIFILL